MMNNYSNRIKQAVLLLAGIVLLASACKKDEYYLDGGVSDPTFDGSIIGYLDSKPFHFDTIATLVRLAGLEDEFSHDSLTFFAPTDNTVKNTVELLNDVLYMAGKDTIRTFDQVDTLIWRKYLSRYLFEGVNELRDYPQIDFEVKQIYPGQNFYSYDGDVMNIGLIYHDQNGVQYVGYRQLSISFIPDVSRPESGWTTALVASANIRPLNGAVHVLSDDHTFLFDYIGLANELLIVMPDAGSAVEPQTEKER